MPRRVTAVCALCYRIKTPCPWIRLHKTNTQCERAKANWFSRLLDLQKQEAEASELQRRLGGLLYSQHTEQSKLECGAFEVPSRVSS